MRDTFSEEKVKLREELKKLVEEYEKSGGEIKLYGTLGNPTIERRDIKTRYEVSDREIDDWIRQKRFPMKVRCNSTEGKRQKNKTKQTDTYFFREVDALFRNRLYDRSLYERYVVARNYK